LLALVVLATTMFIKKTRLYNFVIVKGQDGGFIKKSRLYNFVIVKGQDGVWHFR